MIADEAVARSYLSLMSDLGVDINLSKSLQSNKGFGEFAKRLVSSQMEVTPAGAKSANSVLYSVKNLPLLLFDLMGKGYPVSFE